MSRKFQQKKRKAPAASKYADEAEFSDLDSGSEDDANMSHNTANINRLFGMGFVSLEEVETFDPKKFLAEEAEAKKSVDKSVVEDAKKAVEVAKTDKKPVDKKVKIEETKAVNTTVTNSNGWNVTPVESKVEVKVGVKVGAEVSNEIEEIKEVSTESVNSQTQKKKKQKQKKPQKTPEPSQPTTALPSVVHVNELTEWRRYSLHPLLLSALKDASFATPTAIQSAALKSLFTDRSKNLMASAPTGSGKTLAFGIPILDYIYKQFDATNESGTDHHLTALIIVPTRELAIQIERHLKAMSKHPSNGRVIKIASVIGGMSPEKQERLLSHQPQIIIATPGRLAEAVEFNPHARSLIESTRFLVLDEADRMVQRGHFQELDPLLAKILSHPLAGRQILLFSATLAASKEKNSPFSQLCQRLNLDRCKGVKEVAVVDLAGRPSQLQEWQCSVGNPLDKDGLIMYFLADLRKSNPDGKFGRVLMFVNAVETIRRLSPLFKLLGVPNYALHAQMQQRQRLKNLDRFIASDECLLIASDVAARGLDIQGIQHVVHYHLPKDKDTYTHRCGRTARGSASGTSLAIYSGSEEKHLAGKCGLLDGMQKFTVHEGFLNETIVPAIKLARRIESLQHTDRATKSQVNWAEKVAEELGVTLDETNDPSWKQRQAHAEAGLDSKQVKKEIEVATKKLQTMITSISTNF